MTTYHIATIPGDGIGPEVTSAAISVLADLATRHEFVLDFVSLDWDCSQPRDSGTFIPPNGLALLEKHDAIYLGAVGRPDVSDADSLWGLLIPIRRHLDQFINLRPVTTLNAELSPLSHGQDIDIVVVRENSEGEYSEIGGHIFRDTPREVVVQDTVFTRTGVERTMRYAFELALQRRQHLTVATKSNGIVFTMPFWDSIARSVSEAYPLVVLEFMHADAVAAKMILEPQRFDVIVASNLLGDILSEIGAALIGGIGLAASANLNPTRQFPSMFEPVHGSAPDIAGLGISNPIGQILAGAMMLEHLGEGEAATCLENAVKSAIASSSVRTPDLGGTASNEVLARAVLDSLDEACTHG